MHQTLYLVFEGDEWLSNNSLRLMCICDGFNYALGAILCEMLKEKMFDEDHSITDAAKMLTNQRQTQGFKTNYIIKTAELNKWEEV